ncbi:MAG: hypothetical protein JF603_00335 [Acidobacteria bacterium]|nr:hypothetical protein [Acidobacteriota bacterium]
MRKIAGIGLVGVLLLSGCVNHELNAKRFCRTIDDRLTTPINDQGVPVTLPPRDWSSDQRKPLRDEVEHLESSFNKAMKFSEDGTKEIRKSARHADKSYLDIFIIIRDKKSKLSQLKTRRAELKQHLAELKDVCSPYL